MTPVLRQPRTWLVVSLLITSILYWPGLRGPFLLDDYYNFLPLQEWLAGDRTLRSVLFDGRSGTFGRPLAMASFALNTWYFGYQPYGFKLGNLLVHMLCGGAVYQVILRIALRDRRLAATAPWVALAVASAWLLHPLHASTVLYSVQRMAQLSTLCVLLGLWTFMAAREALAQAPSRRAWLALFLGIPFFSVAGFLAKESAILLPALCLVLELGCYRTRPRAVKAFFSLFLFLPLAAGSIALAINPGRILDNYSHRDFGLGERLLTQARALCDYLWKTIAPNPPTMGVYTDDYVLSTSLLAPPSTLAALAALLAISALAWRLRGAVPALLLGWTFFLVGHLLESSVIALELYFEHRNYLPMVGVLYALAGLAMAGGEALRQRGLRTRRIAWVLSLGVAALLALGTHGRARAWGSEEALAVSSVFSHPQSVRANMLLVKVAMERNNREAIDQALERLAHAEKPRNRALGLLNRLYLHCALDKQANPEDLAQAMAAMPPRMSNAEPEIFALLVGSSAGCAGLSDRMLGDAMDTMLDRAATQGDQAWPKWNLRYNAAQFYARAGDWNNTLIQAQLAWQPAAIPAVAEILVEAQLATGDLEGAEQTWREAGQRADPGNAADRAGLAWLRERIDRVREGRAPAP